MLTGQKRIGDFSSIFPGLALLPPRYCSPVLVSALQCIYTTHPSPSNVRQLNQTFPTLLHPSPCSPVGWIDYSPNPRLPLFESTLPHQRSAWCTFHTGCWGWRCKTPAVVAWNSFFPLLCLLRAVFWRHFRGQLVAGNRYWLCRVWQALLRWVSTQFGSCLSELGSRPSERTFWNLGRQFFSRAETKSLLSFNDRVWHFIFWCSF